MLSYTYLSSGKFGLIRKPKPVLRHDRDAIVRVTLSSICTSDLHIKHGTVPRAVPGVTVGHEHHGTTVAAIATVRAGQRLVFLTTDAGRTVAPIAALDMDGYSIHKITHIDYLTKKPRPYGRGLKKA